MRIIIDLQGCQATSRFKGIGKYSTALTKAFLQKAEGHEVWVALNSAFHEGMGALRESFAPWVPDNRILVYDVPGSVAQVDVANAHNARAAELIREHVLGSVGADLIWNSSLFEGWFDNAVSSVGNVPGQSATAATFYDLIPLHFPDDYLGEERIKAWYQRQLAALKRTDLLFAISDWSRRDGIEQLEIPEQSIVSIGAAAGNEFRSRSWTDDARSAFYSKYGIRNKFVFYTGGFAARKNVPNLLIAYAQLGPSLRQVYQLVIGGQITDVERSELKEQMRIAGLGENEVVLTGYLAESDLAHLYSACAVFVFPSLHEGFGLPVLEAMSCGAPVLASNTSSMPEIVDRSDALFDPTDAWAMASRMKSVLLNADLTQSMRSSGLQRAKHYSWARSAGLVVDAMEGWHDRVRADRSSIHSLSRLIRPTMAYVSPLPPLRSGISDYSAQLLPALAAYYDIDVVVDQPTISDAIIQSNFPMRSIAWFKQHAKKFDRVLYHIGNSPFHAHMFGLLEQFPGTVVLHDTYLIGVIEWIAQVSGHPESYLEAIYFSHGFGALLAEAKLGSEYARKHFPVSLAVFKNAQGVLVHSRYASELAQTIYGDDVEKQITVLPFPKPLAAIDRVKARQSLGIDDDVFLVCSFGLIDPHKLNDRLLKAWISSLLAKDIKCMLVFVGQNHGGDYGADMESAISKSSTGRRIVITGFADSSTYNQYLQASDLAVQLRTHSRGETSAAVFDCMAHGVPLIVNAHATLDELPNDAVFKLKDQFADADLAAALERLYAEPQRRRLLAGNALATVKKDHLPATVAKRYQQSIEGYAEKHYRAREERVYDMLGRVLADTSVTQADLAGAAAALIQGRPRIGQRQILVDISAITRDDLKTGIQRVVRNVLGHWLGDMMRGYRVEPIRFVNGRYVYARPYTLGILGLDGQLLQEEPILVERDDIVVGLDLAADTVVSSAGQIQMWRERGARVYFVVYDLLPLLQSKFFPSGSSAWFRQWLLTVAQLSNGLICISRAVADELMRWLNNAPLQRGEPLQIGYFHLGADPRVEPVLEPPVQQVVDFQALLGGRPTVLMVGTVEPRKGHTQALAAFEEIWAAGAQVNLLIVGKKGWMVDELADRVRADEKSGRRIIWLEKVDDKTLEAAYKASDILLAASEGEGFGLPLIEAAEHSLDVLARDLPVFHEVGGNSIRYFGSGPGELANALLDWLQTRKQPGQPDIKDLRWLNWQQSSMWLRDMLLEAYNPGWLYCWRASRAHGYSFIDALEIDFANTQDEVALSGWSLPETWGRWSSSKYVKISIAIAADELLSEPLRVCLDAQPFLSASHSVQNFIVLANGYEVHRWQWYLGGVVQRVEFNIPEQLLHGCSMLEIVIQCPDSISPKKLGLSEDSRDLGLAMQAMSIRRESSAAPDAKER